MNGEFTEQGSADAEARRILLIDDEECVGLVLRRVLPQYEIRQEISGAAGLAAVYAWRPDLILLDLHLPDIQGEKLAAIVRSDRFIGQTPIVILTATLACGEEEQPVTRHNCPAFGKPFNVAVLRWYVETELQRSTQAPVELV